jgi:hypothetical protein
MPISADETKRYLAFAYDMVRELGSMAIHPDTILWHYTNGSSLIEIVNSASIFATQVSCLNDTTEVSYASRLYREALENQRRESESTGNQSILEFIDSALEHFKEDTQYPTRAIVPFFVACFSEEKDDLSQWRAYGGGENGYAIAFRAGNLGEGLARANYDVTAHRELAKRATDATVRFFLDGLSGRPVQEKAIWTSEFLAAWDSAITLVAPIIKHPGFYKERECRIIKSFLADDLAQLRFIQKGTLMSRHLPLRPSRDPGSDTYILPIAEVMVGPCRHPEITRTSVDTLLRQKGYEAGLVSISKIPFQVA